MIRRGRSFRTGRSMRMREIVSNISNLYLSPLGGSQI